MRVSTMCQRAELAWRSPLRLSRCRWFLPLLASSGDAPQRWAKAASLRSRSPGQHAQGELGQRDDVALGSGSIGRGPLEKVEDAEPPELGPDGIRCGRDQVAHLVERLGPTFAGRGPGHTQNPHGFDVSVPRLGFTAGLARKGSPGGRDGVLGIGLAFEAPTLAIGSVNFDHSHALGLEMTGEPCSIGPSPFDADQLDGAEVAQPAQQLLVTGFGRGEALDSEQGAPLI